MPTVDLSHWHLSFGGSDSRLFGTKHYHAPTIVKLATPVDLLLHLANDGAWDPETQNQIRRRLEDDPVAKEWHWQRNKIGSLPHFREYRKSNNCDNYHAAARAVSTGDPSRDQQELVDGLDREIAATTLIVPAGQVLFHGRGDHALHSSSRYPSFISTSLDPVVCIHHAIKRKIQNGSGAKAFIYAITLREPLHAIWGNGGALEEWELLLQSRLRCCETAVHSGTRFDVIEATIGAE